MNNFLVLPYIYTSWYAIAIYLYWRKFKSLNCGFMILIIWGFSALIGAWYENNPIWFHYHQITLIPYIYLFLLNIVLFWPVLSFKNQEIQAISANEKVIDILISILIIINTPPFIENLLHVFNNISNNKFFSIDDFNARYDEGLSPIYYMSTVSTKLEHIADGLRLVLLSIFFYYFIRPNYKFNKYQLIGLLICIFNIILTSINSGSRVTIIMYILVSCLLYIIFSPFYPDKTRKIVKNYSLIFFSILVLIFLVVTTIRFNDIKDNKDANRTLTSWIASYIGESHGNFNADAWYLEKHHYSNNDIVMNTYEFFMGNDNFSQKKISTLNSKHPIFPDEVKNVQFYSSIGSYAISYGVIVTAIIVIIVSLLFKKIINYRRIVKISDIVIFIFYAKIPLLGFTYFCYQYDSDQLVYTPLIYILFRLAKS